MDFSPENLRARFTELNASRDAILADLDPIREERDALVASYQGQEHALNTRIKELSQQLYPIDQERGMIVRALGGKTGEPPAAEDIDA